MAEEDQASAASPNSEMALSTEKIYVKDSSYESPNTPGIYSQEWQPELKLELGTKVRKFADNTYEVILALTVTAKLGDKTAFLVEIHQAGVFVISGFEEEQVDGLLNVHCPTVLFPFASAAVTEMVARGGFPQLVLQPVNFESVYQQKLQRKTQENAGEAQAE